MVINFRLLVFLHLLSISISTFAISSNERHLNIVFAGNMPDISLQTYGTYASLAGLIEETRNPKKTSLTPTIFVFGGGSLGPSPLSSLDRGSHIIDILNTLEPDLMTLTKREFSYFEDELTLRSYEAAFPLVSSNLFDPLVNGNLEGVLTNLIVEKKNVKVGFISILDEEVVEEYLLDRAQIYEPRQIILQQIDELKLKGADLVALIYAKERDYYRTLISENKIDFALRVRQSSENTHFQPQSDKIYSISFREPFISLRMNWQTNSPDKKLTIIQTDNAFSGSPMQSTTSLLVDEYNQRLNRLLNQKIGQFGREIQTLSHLVRTAEMPFGNFITDALKHYAKTDVSVINGGVIRGEKTYAKGTIITRRDIAIELPFRSHLTVLNVSGLHLRAALENSVSHVEQANGRFLQVSGISFTYSLEEPVGQRIKNININGNPLDSEQIYSVATSDYLASGGNGYDVFLNAPQQEKYNQTLPLLSDVVISMIQQQKTINPKLESRIKRVTK